MMKRRLFIVLAVLLVALLFIFFNSKKETSGDSPKTTSTNATLEVSPDSTLNISIFSSDDKRVHIKFTPMVNLSLQSDDYQIVPESVEVKNFELSFGSIPGKRLARVYPTDTPIDSGCTGYFYEPCDSKLSVDEVKDMGADHTFRVVENPRTMGELASYLGPLTFSAYVFDVGEFDKQAIKDRDGKFSSDRVLDYAEVDRSKLDGTLSFDVVVKLSDGTQVARHVSTEIDGDKIGDVMYAPQLVVD